MSRIAVIWISSPELSYVFRGGIEDGSLLPGQQILFFGPGPCFQLLCCPGGHTLGLIICFPCVNVGVLKHI